MATSRNCDHVSESRTCDRGFSSLRGFSQSYLLIQEGDTGLKTPRRRRLVGAQAVGEVEVLHAADRLLVELALRRRIVEVEVTTEDLVATLAAEHHLDAHGLDLPRQEEHGRRRADGGHVVGLEVVDDVRQGVETVLDGEGHDVVLGAEELGDLERRLGVGGTGEADGEGVELGEVGDGRELVVLINADQPLTALVVLRSGAVGSERGLLQPEGLALGDGSDQAGVKTAGQEDTVGNFGHEPLPDRALKGFPEELEVKGRIGDLGGIPPGRVVVPGQLVRLRVVDVAGGERLDLVADGVQALELGGEVDSPGFLRRPAHVEGGNADGVARRDHAVLLLVVEDEGEHAVEMLGGVDAILHILQAGVSGGVLHRSTIRVLRLLLLLTRGITTSQSEWVLKL